MTQAHAALCDELAAMLAYPATGLHATTERCLALLAGDDSAALESIQAFCAETKGLSNEDMEELFTRTFDYNPSSSLEIGWHLFGEQYERGAFLVRMRQEMRRLCLVESSELPDHLTHVLAVLGRIEGASATEFATTHVLPALELMYTGVKDLDSPYEHVLAAIRQVLTAHFGPARRDRIPLPLHREHEDLFRSEGRQ